MRTSRAAAGIGALVLFAGLSGFTYAPSANPPGCDPNAPGSCDKYHSDDPYVGGGQVTKAAPKTVVMTNFSFLPATVIGKPGEVWTEDNEDIATHNITTQKRADHPKSKADTGGDIAPDVMSHQKKTFKMPTKPGTYKSVCFYHQNMVLTIVVK
jgi:plastocyanin